jgi:hypothetical protein
MAVSAKSGNAKIATKAGEPPKGTPNPWDSAHWNLTKQMTFAKQFGLDVAREWAAAAGTTIGGPRPKKKPAGGNGAPGPQGPRGRKGADSSDDGWSPELAVVNDGDRCVLQIADWEGGTGTKPVAGDYLGLTGLVGDIADAVDIRGIGWTPVLAIAIDPPPPGAEERITELGRNPPDRNRRNPLDGIARQPDRLAGPGFALRLAGHRLDRRHRHQAGRGHVCRAARIRLRCGECGEHPRSLRAMAPEADRARRTCRSLPPARCSGTVACWVSS